MTVGKHGEAEQKRGAQIRSKKKERETERPRREMERNTAEMGETENRTRSRTVSRLYPIIMAWTICPHGPHLDAQKKEERKEDSES